MTFWKDENKKVGIMVYFHYLCPRCIRTQQKNVLGITQHHYTRFESTDVAALAVEFEFLMEDVR
jgi:hypothetical protein